MDWEPRVGMRVVCINAAPRQGQIWNEGDALTKGRVYTVSDFFIGPDGIVAIECDGKPRNRIAFEHYGCRIGYGVDRFLPLDERRLDIFRSILTQAPTEKEPA